MIATRLGYSVFMLVAAIVAGCILRRSQGGLGLSPGDRWTLAISGLVGATLAAKLPFWIFAQTASSAIISLPGSAWLADGKTILWALAGGYGGVELGKWMLDIRARTGDTLSSRSRLPSRSDGWAV
jgi:ABC-type branched-subunit amino acid transport system permease subunit